jgi:hypothetical protein
MADKDDTPSSPPAAFVVRERKASSLQKDQNKKKKAKLNNAQRVLELDEEEDPQKVTVYHVKPTQYIVDTEDAINGIVIQFNGYAEKHFSDVVFNNHKKEDVEAQNVCYDNGLALRVAGLQTKSGEIIKNAKGYAVRVLISVIDESFSKEDIKTYLFKELIPDLVAYNKQYGSFLLKEEQVPKMDKLEFKTLDKWCDCLNTQDIYYVMASHFCAPPLERHYENELALYNQKVASFTQEEGKDLIQMPERKVVVTFKTFLKSSQDNIYSIWRPGTVPVKDIIRKYKLTQEHLKIADCPNVATTRE